MYANGHCCGLQQLYKCINNDSLRSKIREKKPANLTEAYDLLIELVTDDFTSYGVTNAYAPSSGSAPQLV
jgi:hypothetical protein